MDKDKYKETRETWNKIAQVYQDKFMNIDLYNHTYDFICNSLSKPNSKVLEIGCGPGNISRYLLMKRPDLEILGIDNAPRMIELAKENNPTASFAVMDGRKVYELKYTYDGIICGFVLPYLSVEDSKELIKNCFTLLNDNGLLYLSFVEGNPADSYFLGDSNGDRMFFNYHNLNEITKQLHQTGFTELNIFKVEYPRSEKEKELHTIITARKFFYKQSEII